jgi:pimeloyl-ACP methyl ester carboxylesterase
MKRLKKILKVTGITLLSIIIIIFVFLYIISPGKTKAFKDEQGNIIENSVSEMEYVKIGGIEQFMLIRGKNKDNPVLLVLHGGPGQPETAMFRKYNSVLEEYYTIVYWEQRGAGKSFDKNIPASSMTLDQFVEDTHELTSYLKERFKKDKIFLLGHSWGSLLGIKTVNKYPDDYYAYIGIGQVSNQTKSEKLSYQFVLNKATEDNNAEALKDLNEIGEYNEENLNKTGSKNWLMKEREWVLRFGGTTYNPDNVVDIIVFSLLFNKEYTIGDKIASLRGTEFAITHLFPYFINSDLSKTDSELKIPVYIMQGINDYQTCYSVAKEYFDILQAPKKEFITFDKSAHLIPFEEPEKFNDIMINKVLKESTEYNNGFTQ